jgi:hypothetical protein
MLHVFLSSTYVDLQVEREAVRDAVLRLQHQFTGMEYFGSDPEKSLPASLSWLRWCAVYIGVIGHRYGSIDAMTGKSITRLEYEYAKAQGIPTLIYEKSEACPVEPTSQFIDFDATAREKLREFKDLARSENVTQAFTSAADLAAKVTADLARLAAAMPSKPKSSRRLQLRRSGWFSAGDEELRYLSDAEREIGTLESAGNSSAIPLLGPKGVGKTVYGCMLIHQPIAVPAAHRISVDVNDQVGFLCSQYRYLSEGQWAPATSSLNRCYTEVIIRKKKLLGERQYRMHLLDTSGEQWSLIDPEYHNGHHQTHSVLPELSECAGLVIFFAVDDPASAWFDSGADLTYANNLGRMAFGQPRGRFPMPVAVVLTKCDLMPDLLGNPQLAANYMQNRYPFAFAQICTRLETFKIFPVSSVGSLDADGNPRELKPFGLWDPIFWLADEC